MTGSPAAAVPAPAGVILRPDDGLRVVGGGSVLIGGVPPRILRLSERGAGLVADWFAGSPVGESRGERRLARRLLDAGHAHPSGTTQGTHGVTVVVPVKNDAEGLGRCLASLADSCRSAPVRVIVVDDGSSDSRAITDVTERYRAVLVRRNESGGPGVARDTGRAEASTELMAFVDADVVTRPGWLDGLLGHFDDPAVVAVAPRVASRPGTSLLQRWEEEHSPLDLGPAPSIVAPGRAIAYVPTAAFVVRASAIEAVGGFDPTLRFGEDVDLVWRLVEAGGVVRYDPAVEVEHAPRESWGGWLRQRRDYGASAAALGRRHGSKVAPARCSAWSALAWGASAAGHPVLGLAIAAGSSGALIRKLDSVPDPAAEAARLAGRGHLHAGLGLARAVRRVWWPLALVGARFRRLRSALLTVMVVPPLLDWFGGRRGIDPVRSVAISLADDLAYGTGVWRGVVAERRVTALLPEFVRWPVSKPAAEATTVRD